MNRVLLFIVFLLCVQAAPVSAAVFDNWNSLEKSVRDSTIDRKTARQRIIELNRQLVSVYGGKAGHSRLRFPVKGYGPKSIGGSRGNGYVAAGYNFYDGNRHGGHPAHDLFIRDPGRSGLDAGTGKPAEIVAFADGVVIAVNTSWEHPSDIRGGKYIWIFNPETDRYYYYAHLAEVRVSPGDTVKAGDTIALLGRTGKNAYPRRSPTHLHFMCLSFDGGRMKPFNTYRELLEAATE